MEEGTTLWHTRNVWLFAFYLAGIRISGVLELKWSDFMNGRLYYEINKNEKPLSLKLTDEPLKILSYYTGDKTSNMDYVFPFLKKLRKTMIATSLPKLEMQQNSSINT